MAVYSITLTPGCNRASKVGERLHCFSDLGFSLAEALTLDLLARRDLKSPHKRAILVDVEEGEEDFQLRADIPGVNKEDITIDVEKNVLTFDVKSKKVTAEHSSAHEEQAELAGTQAVHQEAGEEKDAAEAASEETTWHRMERAGVFAKRSIRLPQTVEMSQAAASYADGVLTVIVPKKIPEVTSTKLQIH